MFAEGQGGGGVEWQSGLHASMMLSPVSFASTVQGDVGPSVQHRGTPKNKMRRKGSRGMSRVRCITLFWVGVGEHHFVLGWRWGTFILFWVGVWSVTLLVGMCVSLLQPRDQDARPAAETGRQEEKQGVDAGME